MFDATALNVPRAVPLLYTDAARLRAEWMRSAERQRLGGRLLAGRKLHHLLASVAEQILSTQVAPSDVAQRPASCGCQCTAEADAGQRGAASMGVAATDPAVASALAMLPAARRCAGASWPMARRRGGCVQRQQRWRSCDGSHRSDGHLRALVVDAWEAKLFCTDVSAGGIFAATCGWRRGGSHSSGRCPKSWRIERSAGKLVVPLDRPEWCSSCRFGFAPTAQRTECSPRTPL